MNNTPKNPYNIDIEAERLATDRMLMKSCQHPEAGRATCGKRIRSHTVPRSSLARMARDGHVWQIRIADLFAVYRDEPTLIKAKQIGINHASTLPIFCSKHDHEVFAPIEAGEVQATTQSALLFHYRAMVRRRLASEYMWRGFERVWHRAEALPEPQGSAVRQSIAFLGVDSFHAWADDTVYKEWCDEKVVSRDFSRIGAVFVEFEGTPNVMCCGSFKPEYDFHGQSLHELAHPLTAAGMMEPVALTVLGTATGGLAVLSWMRHGLAAQRFAESFAALPDERKGDAVMRMTLNLIENYYVSPAWWESISNEEQMALCALYARRLEGRIPKDCLSYQGAGVAAWKVRSTRVAQ